MSWFARMLHRHAAQGAPAPEPPAPFSEAPHAAQGAGAGGGASVDPDRDEEQDRKIELLRDENLVLKAHLDALERIVLKRAGG